MVTPPEKLGAQVGSAGAAAIAVDGSSLVGESPEGFAGLENDELPQFGRAFYRFGRTSSGWVTTPLNPPRGNLLSIGVGDSVWGPAEGQSDPARLRLRAADGAVSEIGPVWPPTSGVGSSEFFNGEFAFLGAAAEASNGVVFNIGFNERELFWPFDSTLETPGWTPGRTGGNSSLYEYTGTGNTAPSLVGVSGGAGSTVLVSQCGTTLGNGGGSGGSNEVSEDGSRVFFVAVGADRDACGGVEPAVNELFARVGGSETVAISEPSEADCALCMTGVPEDAVYEGASADGSRVFFLTAQALLGSDTSENLYEYDFDAPAGQSRVVRVSGGDGTVSEPTAEVLSVGAVSEDGSHVYFTARGVLTSNPNSEGETAQPGAENFYVYERDAQYPAGHTVFIAVCGDTGDGQVTPDGRFLVFTSACRLTPGDTSTARQVFQYDAQTGGMVRVSAGLQGYDSNGNANGEELNALIADSGQEDSGILRGGALGRTQSDDGSFVFFMSPVALTPQASGGVLNVYEYHGGRVWLVAGGASLIGTSASGGDVFFATVSQLLPQDTDTQTDFYDARVDGGFPAPVVAVGCVGDACQGSPSAAPVVASPSSVVFSGAGNLAPPPAARVVVAPKALSAAQKLTRALKVCLKDPKRRRAACEAKARRLYGHSSRAVKSDRRVK